MPVFFNSPWNWVVRLPGQKQQRFILFYVPILTESIPLLKKIPSIQNERHAFTDLTKSPLKTYFQKKISSLSICTWNQETLRMSQEIHQAGACPGFCSMKWLRVFLLPLGGMLVPRGVTRPSIKFAGTNLSTLVERDTVIVKCLVQEYNTMFSARAQICTNRLIRRRVN